MIVLVKGGHYKPVGSLEEAQKEVDAGWKVHINKTGQKLMKAKKAKKKAKKK